MKEYIVSSKVHGKKVILLDDEDYDKIVSENIRLWVNYAPTTRSCYAIFWKNNKRVRLHRWLMECPSDKIVDHINHNTLDNRKCNLRIATKSENQMNVNYIGVYFVKNRWIAKIKINQKQIHLGVFDIKEEALYARWYAERILFKEFAYPKEERDILDSRKLEIQELINRKVQRL